MTRLAAVACVTVLGAACKPPPSVPQVPATSASPAAPVPGAAAAPPTAPPAAAATPALAPSGQLPVERGLAEVGTAHIALLRAVDRNERWTVLCQARADTDGDGKVEVNFGHHGEPYGDALSPYLILGGGPGTAIDALVSRSQEGRYLAILRGAALELVDSQTGQVFAMRDADTQSDNRPGARHRAAAFAGDRLLYIRHRAAGDVLVVHEPTTHAERELPVSARLWRIAPASEQVARIYTVPPDAGFPQLMTSLGRGECLGSPMSYSMGGQLGPTPVEQWLNLDTGAVLAKDRDDVVGALGGALVRTPADGSLLLDGRQLAPASCQAHVLALVPTPPRVLAVCGQKRGAQVLLLGDGLSLPLAALDHEVQRLPDVDDGPASSGVVCDGLDHCVATAKDALVDLRGGTPVHAHDGRLYVRRSAGGFEVLDVDSGARSAVKTGERRDSFERYLLDDDGRVLDLATATVLGTAPSAVFVSARGRVLLRPHDEDGPLQWARP